MTARERFATARVARLATTGPDGPHVVPIVFALSGDTIFHAVDHKPKRTTALKRIDTSVYDEIKSFKDKTLKPGFVNYDLKSDGVGYATSGGYVDDIQDQLQEAADKIKSGETKVPTDPKQVK